MLPITNHRGIHIPHSLATAAAIIALVTALGWDASDSDSTVMEASRAPVEQIASLESRDAETPDGPTSTTGAGAGGRDNESGILSGLLPLVLPSFPDY